MRLHLTSCVGFAWLAMVPCATFAEPVPAQAQAALLAGHAHYQADELEPAIAQFDAALVLAPGLAEAWFFKARSHEGLAEAGFVVSGEDVEARDAARAVQRAKAIDAYRRFLEIGGLPAGERDFEADAYQGLVMLYADTPEAGGQAVEAAQAFVKLRAGSVASLTLLAKTYERLRRIAEAEAAYRALVAAAPGDPKACETAAVFYARRNWDGKSRLPQAVAELERCATLAAGKADAHGRLAAVYWDEAFRNAELTASAADALADKGLAAAERGLALQPDHRECLVFKAQLLRVKAQRAATEELRLRYRNEAQQAQQAAIAAARRQQEREP